MKHTSEEFKMHVDMLADHFQTRLQAELAALDGLDRTPLLKQLSHDYETQDELTGLDRFSDLIATRLVKDDFWLSVQVNHVDITSKQNYPYTVATFYLAVYFGEKFKGAWILGKYHFSW